MIEVSFFELEFKFRSLDFSNFGLRDILFWQSYDVIGIDSGTLSDTDANLATDCGNITGGIARAEENHELFAFALRFVNRTCRSERRFNVGDLFNKRFDFVTVVIDAIDDNDVLLASGNG